MSKFLMVSKGLMFLALAFFFVATPLVINYQLTSTRKSVNLQLDNTREALDSWLGKADGRIDKVQTSLNDWLKVADNRISSLQDTADKRISSLEKTTDKRLASLEVSTFDQIGQIQTNTFDALRNVSVNLDSQMTTLNSNVGDLTKAYANIPSVVGKRFEVQTNCTINQLCWQNMATSILRDGRYAALDISSASLEFKKGFPTIVGNVTSITGSFSKTSDNIARITTPHWYDRLLGYGLNGALLYRQLHPGDLVIKGATQIISSQK